MVVALSLGVSAVLSVSAVRADVQRGYVPTHSVRVMDTRIDDGGPAFGADETRTLHLISRVPLGATAVELNVTALGATEDTSLAIWPSGRARPYTSVLNIGPNQVRSNTVLVDLGDLYAIDVHNAAGSVDVIVDAIGWFTGDFAGMRPMRMVDTRFGYGAKRIAAGADQNVVLGGKFSIPLDAKAVTMNVTALGATEPTAVLLWPAGTPKPVVGQVSVPTGGIHGQSAIVGLGNGALTVSAMTGSVDIVIDVTGWFRADGRFSTVAPQRVVDTKVGTCGIELGPGEVRTFPVTEASDVFAVAVNLGATDASENTYLTMWSAGNPRPEASNLNVTPDGGAVGAVVISDLGPGGQISLFNAVGTVHVTLDVIGVFSGTTPSGEKTPCAMPAPPPPVAVPTTKPPASWQSTMVSSINAQRSAAGAPKVSTCGALNRTAQAYAEVLISTGNIDHTGPDGSSLKERVAASGYLGWSMIGENLAAGQGTVDEVMGDWLESAGHRENILRPEFTHVGLGRARGFYKDSSVESWFWVQVFGTGGSC